MLFGPSQQLQAPLLLKAGNSIILQATSKEARQVQLTHFVKGQSPNHHLLELDIDEVIRRVIRLGGSYPDVVTMLVNADRNRNLPGRLEFDAMPDPTRMAARLRKVAGGTEPPKESVAIPNLFRRLDPKQAGGADRSDSDSAAASKGEMDPSKPQDALSKKPSLMDRLLRRSAN